MNIQYYGHSCFKITTKPGGRATEDVTFFIDPFEKSIGLNPPQGQTDAVFITHDHYDHNNTAALKGNFVTIDTPGEFAIKGINVIGIESFHDNQKGAERGKNTIYIFETEDLRFCHLGDLGTDLTPEQIEKIGNVDILFVPIGGKYTIDGKKAAEISRKIGAAVVIPMHYKIKGSTIDIEDESAFCKEVSNCPEKPVSKVTLKKKDLEEKNMEVILMNVD